MGGGGAQAAVKTLEDSAGRNNDFGLGADQAGNSSAGGSRADADNSDRQQQQQASVIQQQQQQQQLFCPPQTSARNLFWNATRAGQVARLPCPEGSSGRWATWLCDYERLRFVPALSPDFSQCHSNWLARLSKQLYQMLEPPASRQQASASSRQQDEQMIRSILGELSLLAKTKELFGDDLARIDVMISQMIAQLKSTGASQSQSAAAAFGQPQLVSIHNELFAQLASICSSLFDPFQRNAWLELASAEARRHLEARLLGHLREAGLMFAQSVAPPQLADMQPIRQPNVLAGVSVIINGQLRTAADRNSNELSLANRPFDDNNGALLSAETGGAELRLPARLLQELATDGK